MNGIAVIRPLEIGLEAAPPPDVESRAMEGAAEQVEAPELAGEDLESPALELPDRRLLVALDHHPPLVEREHVHAHPGAAQHVVLTRVGLRRRAHLPGLEEWVNLGDALGVDQQLAGG